MLAFYRHLAALAILGCAAAILLPLASPPAAAQGPATTTRIYLPLLRQAGVAGGPVVPIPTDPPPQLPPPSGDVLWVAPTGVDAADRGAEARPLRTLAFACTRARAGQTIRLTAGTFRESAQCVLPAGVRVMGAGTGGAGRTTVVAPDSWNFNGDGVEARAEGYLIRAENVADVIVDQIEFLGNGRRANGAVLLGGATGATLRDLRIVDFRNTGLRVAGSRRLDVQRIYLENSGYEWPPNSEPRFPDGGSLGNLGVHDVTDAVFGFITIKTTDLRGYGIKAANLSRVRFHNLDLDMHPFQSWRGPGPNNFDIEIHGGYAEQVEIAHSRFRQTLSLMGGNEPRYAAVPYTIHVHHNLFDMRNGTYSVEVGTDKMVFDHNWFRGTWTALQNYGDTTTRIRDLTVFNNVVENLSMRFVGLKGLVENLRVFGNTVYLGPGGGQSYLVTLGENNGSRTWLLANNVIVGSTDNPPANRQLAVAYSSTTPPRDVQARNNLFRTITMGIAVGDTPADAAVWGHLYAANLDADPALPTSGAAAFQPGPGSPVVDRGDPAVGVRTAFSGAGRDVGAFELGQPAWSAGPQTTSDVRYLWAPTTSVTQEAFVDSLDVDLATAPGAEIRYTLDGSEPGPASTLYTRPIRVSEPVKLRARAFKDGFGSPTALALDLSKGVQGYPNVGASGTYSASSVYPERESDGSELYGPAKAFDGVTYSWVGWSPAAGDRRPWLQTDLGRAARIRYVELYTRAQVGDDEGARRNFQIQGSNDPTFATFAVLAGQGATALPREGVFRAEVSDPGRYRYIRAAKTADEGFFVTELRILGER